MCWNGPETVRGSVVAIQIAFPAFWFTRDSSDLMSPSTMRIAD